MKIEEIRALCAAATPVDGKLPEARLLAAARTLLPIMLDVVEAAADMRAQFTVRPREAGWEDAQAFDEALAALEAAHV